MPRPTPRDDSVFDALGSPVRREILRLLGRQARPVGELAAQLPVSRPAVSKHLRLLQGAGFVTRESVGNRNLYRLDAQGFDAARDWLDAFWGEALTRFKIAAENRRPGARRG